jgi:hypothetical protein
MLLLGGECTKGVVSMPSLRSASTAVKSRLFAGLACSALLFVGGCVGPLLGIRMQILDFDEVGVQGVGIWLESGQPGQWALVREIPLTLDIRDGKEWILYELELPDGSVLPLASAVERDLQHPDRVTTLLHYFSDGSGSLRVSAYNPAGHSALSLEEIEVQL